MSLCVILCASSIESSGDNHWALRAEGFAQTGHAHAQHAQKALATSRTALQNNPNDIELQFKVLDATYFVGEFVYQSNSKRKKLYSNSVALSEKILEPIKKQIGSEEDFFNATKESQKKLLLTYPYAAKAYFWAAIHRGLWATYHSYFASARTGAASTIRDYGKMVMVLDAQFADAGGLRLLGRLHTVAPKIPFFSFWVDAEYGLGLLEKAYAISKQDPRNGLFLAQAILKLDSKRHKEAVRLLREVSQFTPAQTQLVEQSQTIGEAKKELLKLLDE